MRQSKRIIALIAKYDVLKKPSLPGFDIRYACALGEHNDHNPTLSNRTAYVENAQGHHSERNVFDAA